MAASKSKVVVLSDVHIGIDAPTNWYQSSVHETRLQQILGWVIENADEIQELVLLGDLVDIWTYPPTTEPPTMFDIIAAQPRTLGDGGSLQAAFNALGGNVSYILGNHDGTLTATDIAVLQETVGNITVVDDYIALYTGTGGQTTVLSHGQYWTMFNAPDPSSPWGTLPLGHFVTRALCYQLQNTLKPGQTVASLKGWGAPDQIDSSTLYNLIYDSWPDVNIAQTLLQYMAKVTGMPLTQPITLPGGATATMQDAIDAFGGLGQQWIDQWGDVNGLRAAAADMDGSSLVWFAQWLGIQRDAALVVFGHTHQPVGGVSPSPLNYINSGYECPATPDDPPAGFTFTVIDVDTATAEIYNADGKKISTFHAPVAPVSPLMDFSCYVTIVNDTGADLTLTNWSADSDSYWAVPPAPTIPAGGFSMAWLADEPGPYGSNGTVTYDTTKLTFGCPTGVVSNYATGPSKSYVARSGTGGWGKAGSVPKTGHPLQVKYTLT